MKKLANITLIILLVLTSFSCSNEEDKNLGLQLLDSDEAIAPLVLYFLDSDFNREIPTNDPGAGFNLTLVCTDPNIQSHSMYVKRLGYAGDPVLLALTEDFPTTYFINGEMIAEAFGMEWSDFPVGTQFKLSGTSVDNDGFEITSDNIGQWVQSEASNAYTFYGMPTIKIVNE